jgi:chorismate lyase
MRTVKLTQINAWRQMPPMGQLRPWMTDRGSLTARIVAHFPDFNLQRVMQARMPPFADERRALHLRAGELAIVREVILKSGTTPLIFAHTVAHPNSLSGAWRGLSKLGARPLAEMLFHDPTVARMPMEYRQLSDAHPLLARMHQVLDIRANRVWARRSVFLKHGAPLLVTEVFLPSILHING